MKRYFYITALCLSFFITAHAAHARDTIFVLSPVQSTQALKAQNKNILNYLITKVKPGEKAIAVDGQNFQTLFEFMVKNDPKYNHPKIKLRMNPSIIPAMNRFAENPETGDVQGSVQWSRLYDYLAQNFAPFQDDTKIVILASPLYQDKHNPEFGIREMQYLGDGYLNAPADASSFSVDGKEEYLKNVSIHIGFPVEWASDDQFRTAVTRFHHLHTEGYGSKIQTFTGDMSSLWRRVAENAKALPHGYTRDTTKKLEILKVENNLQEVTSIYEREVTDGIPSLATIRQAKNVQIALRWDCETCDLDLYVKPHHGAQTLYHGNRETAEGVYYKAYTHSGETSYGFEVISLNKVDLRDTMVGVNWASGQNPNGVTGEIRISIDGVTYASPFSMPNATGGAHAERFETVLESGKTCIHWSVLKPTTLLGVK
jgi:hypothetical protein